MPVTSKGWKKKHICIWQQFKFHRKEIRKHSLHRWYIVAGDQGTPAFRRIAVVWTFQCVCVQHRCGYWTIVMHLMNTKITESTGARMSATINSNLPYQSICSYWPVVYTMLVGLVIVLVPETMCFQGLAVLAVSTGYLLSFPNLWITKQAKRKPQIKLVRIQMTKFLKYKPQVSICRCKQILKFKQEFIFSVLFTMFDANTTTECFEYLTNICAQKFQRCQSLM